MRKQPFEVLCLWSVGASVRSEQSPFAATKVAWSRRCAGGIAVAFSFSLYRLPRVTVKEEAEPRMLWDKIVLYRPEGGMAPISAYPLYDPLGGTYLLEFIALLFLLVYGGDSSLPSSRGDGLFGMRRGIGERLFVPCVPRLSPLSPISLLVPSLKQNQYQHQPRTSGEHRSIRPQEGFQEGARYLSPRERALFGFSFPE